MNHSFASRVAARPQPKPAPPPVCPITLRRQLRERGAEFDALCRGGVSRVVAVLPAMPDPRMLYADLQRGRPASLTTVGAALAGASRHPEAARELRAVADEIAAWICGLAPRTDDTLLGAFTAETRAQGDADVAVAAALVSSCVGSLDHAVAVQSRDVAEGRNLLESLQQARRRRASRSGLAQ